MLAKFFFSSYIRSYLRDLKKMLRSRIASNSFTLSILNVLLKHRWTPYWLHFERSLILDHFSDDYPKKNWVGGGGERKLCHDYFFLSFSQKKQSWSSSSNSSKIFWVRYYLRSEQFILTFYFNFYDTTNDCLRHPTMPGVNFTNILRAAFTHTEIPKAQKRQSS